MENSVPIPFQSSYPTYLYVIIPIITAYFGIFVTMSNHYVLRPRIESFLARVSLSSQLVRELIIDILSNMSFITYSFCCFLLTSPSDNSIRLLSFHNTLWVTICLAIVASYKIANEEPPSNIILIKNALILTLCCIDILYHYFTHTSIISFPLILTGLYLINLLINSNEEKFISFTLDVLAIKRDTKYQFVKNYLLSFESASPICPVSPTCQSVTPSPKLSWRIASKNMSQTERTELSTSLKN